MIVDPYTAMSDEERADQMWRVSPSDLDRLGFETRRDFYLAHLMASKTKTHREIDLSEIMKNEEMTNLYGLDNGRQFRNFFGLDEIDKNDQDVLVIIPETMMAITTAFVEGMFLDSIRALGAEKFFKKYSFSATGSTTLLLYNALNIIVARSINSK